MCRIASVAERRQIRRLAQFQHQHASCFKPFLPARQVAERNSRHSDRNITDHAPPYATVKNWVVQFKRFDFSPVMVFALENAKQ
jgi:hypothetical protein